MRLPCKDRILAFCLASILALAVLACGDEAGQQAGPLRVGVMESLTGPRRDVRHGGQSGQANGAGRDQRGGRDQRPQAGVHRGGLEVRRPGRDYRLQEADRGGRGEDHPGHVVQRRDVGGSAPGRGGRRDPVLGSGEQSRHCERRGLHIPYADQRCPGGYRHREPAVGGRSAHAGDHYRNHRLRRRGEAYDGGAVREAWRSGRGRGAVRVRHHRLQVAAAKAVRRKSRCAARGATVGVRGGHHH